MKRADIIKRTVALFPGEDLKKIARRLMTLHIRMADYLTQAPVIATMLQSDHERVADNYIRSTDPLRKQVMRAGLLLLCYRGAKLRDVLEFLDINPGLRGLAPDVGTKNEIKTFSYHPLQVSTIAQQIAKRSPHEQKVYLSIIHSWVPPVRSEGWPMRVWMIQHLPPEGCDVGHVQDLFRARPEWKPHWKWRDLQAHMRKWEESFTQPADTTLTPFASLQTELSRVDPVRYITHGWDMARRETATQIAMYQEMARAQMDMMQRRMEQQMLYGGIAPEDQTKPLSPHTDAPNEKQYGEMTVVRLNTVADLKEEGRRLSHCVGDYGENVRSGRSLIYSVRSIQHGSSLATMELIKGHMIKDVQTWSICQIKAYKNHKPAAPIMAVAELFAREHFTIRAPQNETYEQRDPYRRGNIRDADIRHAAWESITRRLYAEQRIPLDVLDPTTFRLESMDERDAVRGMVREASGRPWHYEWRRREWEYEVVDRARHRDRTIEPDRPQTASWVRERYAMRPIRPNRIYIGDWNL